MTVLLKDDEWFTRCDFCSSQTTDLKHYEPLKHVTTVRAGGIEAEVEDIGPWCACKTCAELVDSDRWRELAERALVPLRAVTGDLASDEFHLEAVKSMWTVVFGERVKL